MGHRARLRASRGFTLLEAVVVLVVLSILAGTLAFAYQQVRRSSADMAGQPVLGVAQSEARRVAAGHGYTFPATLLADLQQRQPSVVADGSTSKIAFTSQASFAPKTTRNTTDTYQVSTAHSATIVAFAVETSERHCWTTVDDTAANGQDATRWAYSEDTPPGECMADLALVCPSAIDGTVEDPTILDSDGLECDLPEVDLPGPRCVLGESTGGTLEVTWEGPANASQVTGYRVVLLKDGATVYTGSVLPAGTRNSTLTLSSLGLGVGETYDVAVLSVDELGNASTVEDVLDVQGSLATIVTQPNVGAVVVEPGPNRRAYVTLDVTGADTFTVTRTNPNGTKVPVVTDRGTVAGQTTYQVTDTTVPEYGVTYTYAVTAVRRGPAQNICGVATESTTSRPSADVPVTLTLPAPDLTGDAANRDGDGFPDDIRITWQPVDQATGYRITDPSGSVWTVTISGTSYTVSGPEGASGPRPVSGGLYLVDHERTHGQWHTYSGVATRTTSTGASVTSPSKSTKVWVQADPTGLSVDAYASAAGTNTITFTQLSCGTCFLDPLSGKSTVTYTVARGATTIATLNHDSSMTTRTVTDPGQPIGSELTYTVTADAGGSKTVASNVAVQYPPAPAFTSAGSDVNGDTVPDRDYDSVDLTDATLNGDYFRVYVYRADYTTAPKSWVYLETGSQFTARTWNSPVRAAGSQHWYKPVAYKSDFDSPSRPVMSSNTSATGSRVAYQAPPKPTVTPLRSNGTGWVTSDANTGTADALTLDGTAYRLQWNDTMTSGHSGLGNFCTESGAGCGYRLYTASGTTQDAARTATSGAPTSLTYSTLATDLTAGQWGTSYRNEIVACNAGGCRRTGTDAGPGTTTFASGNVTAVNTVPGPLTFSSGKSDVVREQRQRRYNGTNPGGIVEAGNRNGEARLVWLTASNEASQVSYTWQRAVIGTSAPASEAVGKTTATVSDGQVSTGGQLTWTRGRFDYSVTSTSANRESRVTPTRFQMAPSAPKALNQNVYCNPAVGGAWKIAFQVKTQGWTPRGDGQNTPLDTVEYTYWVGRATKARWAELGTVSFRRMAQHRIGATYMPDSWAASGWDASDLKDDGTYVAGTEYYSSGTFPADGSLRGYSGDYTLTGSGQNDRVIPDGQTRSGGSLWIRGLATVPSGYDWGVDTSVWTQMEDGSDDPLSCPSGTGWRPARRADNGKTMMDRVAGLQSNYDKTAADLGWNQ